MDRKEYQKQYYLKKKEVKYRPLLLELIGCLVTYLLSVLISIHAFQQFSTGSNTLEMWLFFASVESLIFFLSFNLSKFVGVIKIVRLLTILALTLGLNYMVSKGAYDSALKQKRLNDTVEKQSTLLRESISQLDKTITGFQDREMHTKAVEILQKKENLIQKLDKLITYSEKGGPFENQVVLIIMRFFISILNISVIGRIGQILSSLFKK